MMEANHLHEENLNTGISSLPDEILIKIFSYLNLVHKRACRIVSRRWQSCCEARTITETEKFVFHSPIYQSSEINEFLINIKRSRINVEFIKVDLAALDFKKFGEKIDELQITNCFHQDESILKNLFITTANMTCLRILFYFCDSFSESEIISKKVIGLLQEENFQNTNLKEFQYDVDFGICVRLQPMEDHPFTISRLFTIFPCIECFSLGCNTRISLVGSDLRNVLPKTNITRLLSECVLSELDQWESFAYLSKLEILNLTFRNSSLSINLCKKLFSQVTGLKRLSVKTENLAKILLLDILTSCLKLEKLTFMWSEEEEVCLNNRDEIKLVCTSLLKLQEVTLFPGIRVKLDSEKPDLVTSDGEDFLKTMHILNQLCGPLDLRHMLLNTCRQLTTLRLFTEAEAFSSANHYINITKILQTQKYLKSLTINVYPIGTKVFQVDRNRVILSKHENLEYLKVRFGIDEVCQCLRVFMEWLPTWEFPNLQTLELDDAAFRCPNDYAQSASDEFRKFYSECFTKMSTLTRICLRLNFLKFEDCEKICGQMRELETIIWTEDPGEPQKIVNLFVKLPNLKVVLLHNLQVKHEVEIKIESYLYFYCRSNKKLFKCHSSNLNKGFLFGEWYLLKLDTFEKLT